MCRGGMFAMGYTIEDFSFTDMGMCSKVQIGGKVTQYSVRIVMSSEAIFKAAGDLLANESLYLEFVLVASLRCTTLKVQLEQSAPVAKRIKTLPGDIVQGAACAV
jgi:hypothetical protein